MGTYTNDGGVVSSKLPIGEKGGMAEQHRTMFGLYRGMVLRSVYPDDPKSTNKARMEYVVKVKGQEYPNAINAREAGGIYNYKERIRKPANKSLTGKVDSSQYSENLDGESVFVMFINGNGDLPLIISGDQHPQHPAYKPIKRASGVFDVEEFQGVEFMIADDGSYTITQVGKKDPDGKVLNTGAVGAQFKISGSDGTIQLINQSGSQKILMDANGVMVLDKNGNKAIMDAHGILVQDKNGNKVDMAAASVAVTVVADVKVSAGGKGEITTGGDCKVTAGGKAVIMGSEIDLNGSSGMVLTTVTDPVIDLITGAPTTGVPTVKAG